MIFNSLSAYVIGSSIYTTDPAKALNISFIKNEIKGGWHLLASTSFNQHVVYFIIAKGRKLRSTNRR